MINIAKTILYKTKQPPHIIIIVFIIALLAFLNIFPKSEIFIQTQSQQDPFIIETIDQNNIKHTIAKKSEPLLINDKTDIFALKISKETRKISFVNYTPQGNIHLYCYQSTPFYNSYSHSQINILNSKNWYDINCNNYNSNFSSDFILIITVLLFIYYCISKRKIAFQNKRNIYIFSIFLCWTSFILYLIITLPFNHGPDEAMNFFSAIHYFDHIKPLSVSNEYYTEILWGSNRLAGTSDLPYLLSTKISKFLWYFFNLEQYILVRISQLLIAISLFYLMIIFCTTRFAISLLCIIAIIPQISFLFTYVNDDAVSFIFAVFALSLVSTTKINPTYGFSIFIIICLKLKQNFILLGLPAFFIYASRKNYSIKLIWKDTGLITLCLLLGISDYIYEFFDQYINQISHLDIVFANAHETIIQKHLNKMNHDNILWHIPLSFKWYFINLWSFFGIFGMMAEPIPFLILLILLCIFICIIKQDKYQNNIFIFLILLTNIALSLYNTMVYDYQPQGRYLFPFLVFCIIMIKTRLKHIIKYAAIGYIFSITSLLHYNLNYHPTPITTEESMEILKNREP